MPQFILLVSSVITKEIIRCKFFHSVRVNNLMSCKFHTAQPVLVRGVVSKRYPSGVESRGEQEKLTGPEDFFGIESDKGVIHVSEKAQSCARKSSNSNGLSSSVKEQLLRTSFGHLRFDSDNRPKIHGQYEENIAESEFSYGSDVERRNVQDVISRKGGEVHIFEKCCLASNEKEKSDSGQFTKEELAGSEDLVVKSSDDVNEKSELGFIDRAYFYDESSAVNNSSDLHKGNLYLDSSRLNSNFQEKEAKEGNTELPQNSSDQQKGGDSFIDNIYFEGLYDANCSSSPGHSNQAEAKPVASVQNHTSDYAASLSELKNEDVNKELNFIDSMYFGTTAENTFSSQDNGDLSICSISKTPGDNIMNSNSVSEDNGKDSEVDSSNFLALNQGTDSICSISKTPDDNIMHSNSVLEDISKDSEVDSSNFLALSQGTEENLSSPMEQNYILNASENEAGLSQDVLEQKKLIKELERELYVTEAKLHSHQAPSDDSKVNTAYKYVLQLRKTGAVPDTQKGVKCDSKGFRILKNQVPDLSQYTQNELTDLLKERVLFSDDDIVVLNKPYNFVVHESKTTKLRTLSSVLDDLARKLDPVAANPQLHTVHRLDKETTGCLLLARSELAAQKLKSLFAHREIEKNYLVVTTRVPELHEGVIDIPIAEGKVENKVRMVLQPDIPKEIKYRTHVKNGKRAITYYKVVGTSENAALLEVRPETGLKHQIRVHLGFGLNCPILGDHKYSHLTKLAPQRLSGDILRKLEIRQSKVRHVPMHIHSRTVIIPKYLQGRDLFVSAPLPEHIKNTLKYLKFKDI